MSPDLLLTPLAAAVAILGAVVVLDARTIFIREVDVPLQLWASGFNSLVVQEELANAILDIEREGRARESTRKLALEEGDDALDLVTEYFELTPLVRAFQQSGGFVAYGVDSHVTENGGDHVLEMEIDGRDGSEVTVSVAHPKHDAPGLIRKGAEAIMRVTDPEPLCASYLARAIRSNGGLDRAEDCVRETLPAARSDSRAWLLNLAGVIRFIQGDQAAAMERFREALRIEPSFSPALVNVGVLLQESGKPAEATQMLREAIAADPKYAQSYFQLADLLPSGPEADALRRRGELVARSSDQLYTENLVGAVFDAGKARARPL